MARFMSRLQLAVHPWLLGVLVWGWVLVTSEVSSRAPLKGGNSVILLLFILVLINLYKLVVCLLMSRCQLVPKISQKGFLNSSRTVPRCWCVLTRISFIYFLYYLRGYLQGLYSFMSNSIRYNNYFKRNDIILVLQ